MIQVFSASLFHLITLARAVRSCRHHHLYSNSLWFLFHQVLSKEVAKCNVTDGLLKITKCFEEECQERLVKTFS